MCNICRPLTRQQPILLPGEESRRKSGIPPGSSLASGGSATPPSGTGPPVSGKILTSEMLDENELRINICDFPFKLQT